MTESESVALPLGDTPINKKMGWVVGFEPTNTGATTLGLSRLTIPTILLSSKNGDQDRARTDDLQRDRLAF